MGSLILVVGGSRSVRQATAEGRLRAASGALHHVRASTMPFARRAGEGLPASGPLLLRVPDLEEAFPSGQAGSTRLVLTQSTYQLQRWLDWIDARGDVTLVADAGEAALRAGAPEAFAHRGPWSRVEVVNLDEPANQRTDEPTNPRTNEPTPPRTDEPLLVRAFRTLDAEERLALCRRAADASPDDSATQVALGSAYIEVQDLEAARATLEHAVVLDSEWEAAHYELGKLWLRMDDMERACGAFAEAGRLMPSFSAAFSNLGATLGELDRPEEAVKAFEQALKYDPNGYTILNNVGVVCRELGRLGDSEAAFRKVTALAPDFVFGHYNLGHTLFLQGRYQAALSAYVEGQRRDPDKNARQASRLAVVRLAAGDPSGSVRDLQRYTANLPADLKREILLEAQEILWALLTTNPALPGWREVADFVNSELATRTRNSERGTRNYEQR